MAKTKTTKTADKKPVERVSSIRNIFLSEKRKTFTNQDDFYLRGAEVVLKKKEVVDKANCITSKVKLERITKGGLYQPKWIEATRRGVAYEVETSGFIVTYTVEDEQNETYVEHVNYFDLSQMKEAMALVIQICHLIDA